MESLPEHHPEVYQHFQAGLDVGRRSDRYWEGLSLDLLIDEVLMMSLKTTLGLTRGCDMTDTQHLVWLLSANACLELNLAMQELTSENYMMSEQHIDTSASRHGKDMADTDKLIDFLISRCPFHDNTSLYSIITRVTADSTVSVPKMLVLTYYKKSIAEHSFKKKEQLVTLSDNSTVRIRGK